MAFWIAIGLIVAAWIIAIVVARVSYYYDLAETTGAAALATLGIGVVGLIVILIGAGATADREAVLTDRYELRALVTKDSIESGGSAVFFLGFGYASSSSADVTTISFIQTAEDGDNSIRKVNIDESLIYEDLSGSQPYMETWAARLTTNGWWLPWTIENLDPSSTQYRFHIPDGSIYEGYDVNP